MCPIVGIAESVFIVSYSASLAFEFFSFIISYHVQQRAELVRCVRVNLNDYSRATPLFAFHIVVRVLSLMFKFVLFQLS